ncbi:MAG: TonB-dependent receptor [Bacteroidetes bacterium]|nr:TonB-dependent receptor [Bacteroidota bacterium]
MWKAQCLVFLVWISLIVPAKAQMNANLDSVIVHENRFSASLSRQNNSIQILSREEIAALPVHSVTELLAYVSGVDLRQRGPWGTQADLSIYGSNFDQVLVLLNGVKMSDPQTGHHLLNLPLPLSAIDHIEVLRGAAARKYGVNALAGAINIITQIPAASGLQAQAYAGSSLMTDSSNGETFYNWGAQATATFQTKNMAQMLSLDQNRGNGFRYNTAYEDYRLFYQNQWRVSEKSKLDAQAGYFYNHFGASLFYAAPNDAEATETTQTAVGSLKWTQQLNDRISISPRLSYRYNKDDYIYLRQNPELYHNIHETNVLDGEIQSSIRLGKGSLGLGIEQRQEQIGSNNLGRHQRDNTGFYAEYKHPLSKTLSAGGGVYLNYNSDYGWQAFPSLDFGYEPIAGLRFFANASTGQRLPTYTDLYYNGPSNIGNPGLLPEQAQFSEAGFRFQRAAYRLEGNYFYRHTTNYIDWVRADATSKWQPQNFQTVNTQGFSVETNLNLNAALRLPEALALNLKLGYTYLDMDIQKPSEQLTRYTIEALRHQAIAMLHAQFLKHFECMMSARYQYRISQNDYTLLDARIAYHGSGWSVFTELNNMLNTDYKESGAVPLPGRWWCVGLRLGGN